MQLWDMAGRRSLTKDEERRLLQVVRKRSPRDHTLIAIEWFLGVPLYKILRLTIGDVWKNGAPITELRLPRRNRLLPAGSELVLPLTREVTRALQRLVKWHQALPGGLRLDRPLLMSRNSRMGDRALSRGQAHAIVHQSFAAAEVENDGRLGSQSLRKTFGHKAFRYSGGDIITTRECLGHADVADTEDFLDSAESDVTAVLLASEPGARRASPVPPRQTPRTRHPFWNY
jgi:integrase